MTAQEPGPDPEDSFLVRIGRHRFDPAETVDPADLMPPDDTDTSTTSGARSAGGDREAGSGPADTRLVQFHRPLTAEQMDRLIQEYGLDLTSYLPANTYVERVPAGVRSRLADDPLVRAVAPYLPAYKLSPSLEADEQSSTGRAAVDGEQGFDLLGFDRADLDAVANALEQAGATGVETFDDTAIGGFRWARFTAPAGFDLTPIVALPDVRWVEPTAGRVRAVDEPSLEDRTGSGLAVANRIAGGNVQAVGIHHSRAGGNPSVWNRGIHGEGQIIAVVDEGPLDIGHDFFRDPANPIGQNHRKVRNLPGGAVLHPHASEVAGIAAGDDVTNPGGHLDRGGAYAARIVDKHWVFPAGIFAEFVHSSQQGASIHNNSWSTANTLVYSIENAGLDRFAHRNEDDLVVACVPNTGGVMSGPCLTKNAVCVAAAASHLNHNAFGSGIPGPTYDGRRKPDLAAIGGGMDAVLPNVPPFPPGLPLHPSNAMVGVVGSHTSYATPHVSAAAALIRQYFRDGYYPSGNRRLTDRRTPTGALLKAMLVASCEEMNAALGGYPNNQVGWGLIMLDNVLPPLLPAARRRSAVFDVRHNNGLVAGAAPRAHRVTLAQNGPPLRIVLAYTDRESAPGVGGIAPPPGGIAPPLLTNNLNLRVTDPNGVVYRGNHLAGGFSVPNGANRDDHNPVEVVQVANPPGGRWLIEIEGTAIPVGRQGYAVVVLAEFAAGATPVAAGITLGSLLTGAGNMLVPIANQVVVANPAGGGTGGAGRSATPGIDLDELTLLMARMGLPAAVEVLASTGVLDAVAEVMGLISALPTVLDELKAADEAGDTEALALAVAEAGPLVKTTAESVGRLATAFGQASGGDASGELAAFASDFPQRFFGYALATHLEREHPAVAGAAGLFDLIEATPVAATEHTPAHTRRGIRFDRLGQVLADPVGILAERYGWGTPDLDTAGFFDQLVTILTASGAAFVEPDPDTGAPVVRLGPVEVGLTPDAVTPGTGGQEGGGTDTGTDTGEPGGDGGVTPARAAASDLVPGIRARMAIALPVLPDLRIPIGPNLALELALETPLDPDLTIDFRPPAGLIVTPPSLSELDGTVRAGISATDLTLLGRAGGSRIEAAELRASAGTRLAWNAEDGASAGAFLVEAAIRGGRVVLSLGGADSFLRGLLPGGGLTLDFDLLVGWSEATGLHLDGGAGLTVDLPAGFSVGPVRVDSLHLGLLLDPTGLGLDATGSVSARLGPVSIDVEPMGATARLVEAPGGGNLGIGDFDVTWRPPTGLGFSLDAGIAKGGGFLYHDEAANEYSGALELKLGPVSIKALGILTTELPDGSEGWALLLLLFSEFRGFQLGFGFTLEGVGGIIGLQHGVDTRPLQSGLRTGAIDAVLFPADPVGDAPELLDRLRTVFPIVPRALTVGPALKLGWGTPPLVTLKLGVVLQFDDVLGAASRPPSLERVVLLGQLLVQAPPKRRKGAPALLQLRVDLIGVYDVDEKALAIDAVLYDSHVGFASLGGTMVVRARFGDRPDLVVAVGGFHPRFQDVPPGIPPQRRAGFRLDYGPVDIQVLGYVALTTNTFQVGADASLVARGGNFQVSARLGFDALFILEPVFRFEIDFRVDASVKWKKWTLFSIRVEGSIAGPGRWNVSGSASFEILFWRPTVRFSASWGRSAITPSSSVDVGAALFEALNRTDAWSAALPEGEPLVTLLPPDPTAGVVAHPLSRLAVTQTVVPLGIRIDRVGRDRPSGDRLFTIDSVTVGDRVEAPRYHREHFARGQYLDLSDSRKLSSPSFESFDAGATISSNAYTVGGDTVGADPGWETGYLAPDRPTTVDEVDDDLVADQTRFAPASRSRLRRRFPTPAIEVSVVDPEYVTSPAAATTVGAAARSAAARATGARDGDTGPLTYTLAAQRADDRGELVVELAELVTR